MLVLLLFAAALGNYSFVTPTIAAQNELGIIANNRTQGMAQESGPTCISVTNVNCAGYKAPSSQPKAWPICVYQFPYTPSSTRQSPCTINQTSLPAIERAESYREHMPTLYGTEFYAPDATYEKVQKSFRIYSVNNRSYVNMSALPAYGTAISPSGRVKVAYTSEHVAVYFALDSSDKDLKVLTGTDLFPTRAAQAGMSVTSVDVSDEFLLVLFASVSGGSGVALRVFELKPDASAIADKIKKLALSGQSADTDMIFTGSVSGTKIGSFTANNCHQGSVALDKVGTKDYILAVVATCPKSTYTYNYVATARPVGTAFAFILKKDGTWLGQITALLLVPSIAPNTPGLQLSKNFQFTAAVIQGGNVFLSGESKVLYYTSISESDYKKVQSTTKALSTLPVFGDPSSADPDPSLIPGSATSTVGPAMAFTYNQTLLVGIDADESPASVLEYNLTDPLKIVKIGTITGTALPQKISPLGSGLGIVAIIDTQDRSQVKFALLPSFQKEANRTTSLVSWMTVTVPTAVRTVEEAVEFNILPGSLTPRSRRSMVSISYSNDNIIAFNPLNDKASTTYLGNLSLYNIGMLEDGERLQIPEAGGISAGTSMTIVYNTSFELPSSGTAETYIGNCSLFTLQYTDSSIAILPQKVATESYIHPAGSGSKAYISCNYTFQAPIYAQKYQVGLYSSGVKVASKEITVHAGEQATVNSVVFSPKILRRGTPFNISLTPGDKYGNRLSFPAVRGSAPTPDCSWFKVDVYNISQYPEDIDYSVISKIPLQAIETHNFERGDKNYCIVKGIRIKTDGQYFFNLTTNSGGDLILPSTVQSALVTWVNLPAGAHYPARTWIVLMIAIILLVVIMVVVPFVLYRCFNRPPEAVFKGAYKDLKASGSSVDQSKDRKPKAAALNISGQRILPGIPLITVLRGDLNKRLEATDSSEAAVQQLPLESDLTSGSALNRQMSETHSHINEATIVEMKQVKEILAAGSTTYCAVGSCAGTLRYFPDNRRSMLYSFPGTAGTKNEPVTVFAHEFSSSLSAETYTDQLTVWAMLPALEDRLDIKGIFMHNARDPGTSGQIGIPGLLNTLTTEPVCFVVVLTEPVVQLSSPSRDDAQLVISTLKKVIYNSIPARGIGGASPLSLCRDSHGVAKIALPMPMDRAYTLQGLANEYAADVELRYLIAALAMLACSSRIDYKDVLEGKLSVQAIKDQYISQLYGQLSSVSWTSARF